MNRSRDIFTGSLFDTEPQRPGTLGCRIEIAASMSEAIERVRKQGYSREQVASRMAWHLGEKFSVATLNGYTAPSHLDRDISLVRAMAFDAAIGEDVLLGLYAEKMGGRRVITADEAAYVELGRIHQEEKGLAERKRALQAILKTKGGRT